MPRVAGVNIVAVIAGAVVIYFIGFMIYGVIFGEVWSNENLSDHGLLAQFKALTNSEIAFAVDGQVEASTLPARFNPQLSAVVGALFLSSALRRRRSTEACWMTVACSAEPSMYCVAAIR